MSRVSFQRPSFRLPAFRRPAIKPLAERNPLLVGVAGLMVMALIALAVFFSGDLPFIGGGTTYSAYFTEAAGLQPGNAVRIAGVTVGRVTGVSLDGARVLVSFKVKSQWVGNASTVAIDIQTVLGDKYLALTPKGRAEQDPSQVIPERRTASPYDVVQAFSGVGQDISQINTKELAQSLETIAVTFRNSPPYVHAALTGLADLSKSIASRDQQITSLLTGTKHVTGELSSQDARFQALLKDGNLLLTELRLRQQAIEALLTGTQQLAVQLSGLVSDDSATLKPALTALNQVTSVLAANQANLDRALALAGPYYRLLGNALGNGRWFDVYLCGLVPASSLPKGAGPSAGCEPPKGGRG